ncbi:hypothetical protein DFH27DRAFT_609706 [Peziza echinospora]|nr:hypothetical protein DFH27DRAFT_609706 [Peziza echinospora]
MELNSWQMRKARQFRFKGIRFVDLARRMLRAMELALATINEHAFDEKFAEKRCGDLCVAAFRQRVGKGNGVPVQTLSDEGMDTDEGMGDDEGTDTDEETDCD